jgi:hypothetical protein
MNQSLFEEYFYIIFVEVQDRLAIFVEASGAAADQVGVASADIALVLPLDVVKALVAVEIGRDVVNPRQPFRKSAEMFYMESKMFNYLSSFFYYSRLT